MVYRELDKQALKENGYTVLSKITLLNDNSVFTEDDFIVDWNYEDYRYVPNKGFIGEFVERILDGNLQNIPDNKIFENQEINLQIGIVNGIDNVTTWYDYGNFLITKVEKTDTTGRYKFESADYTKKFNKEYEDTINYPCLAMELANDVCNQAEVDLATVNNCYIYIADENGLVAGNYNFKVENTYYNFTLAENLEKNDVLYFTKAYLTLTLKKVRFTQQDGYVVTRNNITYTTSPSSGSGTALIMRSVPFIDFTNNDFVIENNQYDEKDTLRKVMQDIGKLAYSWVRIGEDNKVYIDYEQDASIDDYDKLSTNEYYVSKKADLYFGPVNKVLLGMSNIEGENLYKTSSSYTEETECAIKIYDNNLTYTEELRAIALNGCERLFGIEYMPLEIETIGHPWLNGNEMIELTNVDGEVLRTYPFNRRIKYAGYIEGVIGSEAETKQNNEYEYESEIVKQINKTSITVDKNNQTITSLVSNVNEAQNNITELYQTTNEISATVEHLDTEYENTVIVRREAEGNPIEIDNAGNYPLEDFKIYGGTSQDTTTGKNLLDLQDGTYTNNGVTAIVNNNEISINGTAGTGNSYINIPYSQTIEPQIEYTLSLNNDFTTSNTSDGLRLSTNDDTRGSFTALNRTKTFTFQNALASNLITIRLMAGSSISNGTMKVQLEKGSQATSYEPYTYGASPNPNYPQEVNTVTSKTTTENYNGTYFDVDYSYDKDLIKVEKSDTELLGNTIQNTTILPSEYTQVEYIQNSGTNVINTSIQPAQDVDVEVIMSDISTTNQFGSLFGWRNGNSNQFWAFIDPSQNNQYVARWGTSSYYGNTQYNGGKVKVRQNKNGLFVNDTLVTSAFSSATITGSSNIYIFATNNNGSGQWNITAKLYRARIWKNGELKRDFIPCYRNSDNVIGAYEIVGGAFYTAQGTGAFTKGSNITPPTPDYPQEVQTVTGRQEVSVCGKNLIDVSTTEIGKAWNNTSNDARAVVYAKVEPNTTYTVSFQSKNGADALYWFEKNNKTDSTATVATTGINFTLTKTTSANTHWVGIQINKSNVTLSDVEGTSLQLEKGSTATTYEPYIGNSYEINLGKNLLYKQTTQTIKDVVYTVADDGSINVNGTATGGNSDLYWYGDSSTYVDIGFKPGTYFISGNWSGGSGTTHDLLAVKKDKNSTISYFQDYGSGATMTVNEGDTFRIFFRLYSDTTATNQKLYPQIEKGSQATTYAPYFTPIELCKIGTYQDNIFKGKGVNIVRDKNVNSGTAQYTTVLCADCDLKPSTTYTISFYGTADNIVYPNENLFTTYSSFTIPNGLKVLSLTTKDNLSKESVSQYDSTLQMWRIFKNTQTETKANVFENLQIQEGNVATYYEPYNAKDKWYIYKEIGKHKILASDIVGFYNALTNSREARVSQTTLNCLVGYTGMLYSNKFRKVSNTWNADNIGIMAAAGNPIKQIAFRIPVNSDASWFTNNETILYFPLAIPTTTEITDTELINQLEELNDCEFYSPTSYYRTTSEDLPMTSDFSISHLPYKLITINDENNNQLSYRPLFRNLELCKIGNYQDYLYLKNGKWYKHSEIGKVVLTGASSENWSYISVTQGSLFRLTGAVSNRLQVDDYAPYSNYYKGIKASLSGSRQNNQFYIQKNNNFIDFIDNRFTALANFKTWLSSNNVSVYYILATPTNTEITDEEVITELNSLMQTAIYEGYNRIYLNDELCEKLYIKYLTDSMFNDTYATKAQLAITNENISAVVSRSDTLENNIAQLQIDVDEITTNVESVTTLTTDLENSINYLSVDMSANSIIIPTNEENLPYLSTTYTIPFTATFKGASVNPTVSTSSATITGITLTFGTGVINVGVSSTTPIENLSNSFVINFSYVSDGETYLVSRTLNVALSVKGEDGKDGTSVTILGSYNTLQELQAAHPIGSAGDSYMVGDDLYVWNVASLAWVDVGQIKGDDGVNAYLYIRYSENPNGNPMVTVPTTSTKYIGVCSTTSSTAPTSYSSYTWSKYSGNDGQTTYLHVKYSEDGTTFVPASADADEGDTPSAWVGILTDTNQTASTTFTDYAWYKFTEDIDDQIRTMQSDISKNTTNILNNYSAIIEQLNNYAKSDVVATLTKRVETIENDDAFVINAITDLQVNGVSQVRTEKGFTFNNDGMTIDANNSVTKSVTDTNGIKVLDKSGSSESELLFAGYDETTQTSIVRTENLSVSTYFNIGTKSRFEDYEDGTGVFI